MSEKRTLKVDALARVEGEGAMHVRLRGGVVEQVELRIYEPPRFFEAFLRGRHFTEPPDITARICGICPVAYQLSACAAIEDACGVEVDEPIRRLRRLLYCGEWLQSHALHVFMLHAPDFLGFHGAVEMANNGHRDVVERALAVKKAGNAIIEAVGGRAVHPVNVRVGGFYRAPTAAELRPLVEQLEAAREIAVDAVRWAAGLPFPDYEEHHELVALVHPEDYPLERGRLGSTEGLDIAPAEFDEHFVEEQVPHSNALHCRLRGRGNYLTGPIARYALNGARLAPAARAAADAVGLEPVVRNPFRSIVVRCVEMVHALDEALALLAAYEPPDPPFVDVVPRAGVGHGWTEAPRGMLYHRYELDDEGTILDAAIVPPTSQNQATIEDDLRGFVERHTDLPDDELGLRCEQAIRNYDPCISCATHFLTLDVDRG
jgi:coenzyme F420-reducing hydrogenase alpha subunit